MTHHQFNRPLLVLLVCAVPAAGQRIPDAVPTNLNSKGPPSAAQTTGRAALAKGSYDDASRHLRHALEARPADPTILADLLAAAGDDHDARELWARALYAAVADADGKVSGLDSALLKLVPDDKRHGALATARAAAARELVKRLPAERDAAAKAMRSGVGARRIALAAWELMQDAPALTRALGPDAADPLGTFVPDARSVVAALESIVSEGAGAGRTALVLRAAQVLLALSAQAKFPDLRGPKAPDLSGPAAKARAMIESIRAEQAKSSHIWTTDELNALTAEERGAFSEKHGSWTAPGLAISPKGLYRVETTCGFETLLGVAETIELHHARLAGWYGKDPFVGRPGIVRVVPEPSGLEEEGTPYWWAGGFQSGDVTSVVFSVGNIESLGHLLVHELTHRFDGAVYPFLPAWLSEGRGVWTGSAYASTLDLKFTENYASFGTIEEAFIKGYGNFEDFVRLIEGTVKEYRDNYPAGYALFTYLKTWEVGDKRLYAEKLETFMKGLLRGRGRPRAWFEACFVDGKDQRPKTLEEFAVQFQTFLKGFYWNSRAPWTDRYSRRAGRPKSSPWVYDLPTWHGGRARAEPWFGQDQATTAGDVLFDAGRRKEAMQAYAWALEIDEWDAHSAARFATLAEELGLKDLAWFARAEDARKRPGVASAPGPAPFMASLPKTVAYMKTLDAGVAEAEKAGRLVYAAALSADRDRLATLFGLPPLNRTAALPAIAACRHPFDEPPRPLAAFGYAEDGLTDFEERRVPNLWFATPEGELHVGRKKPRDATGEMDRALLQRDAFTRTKEWIPGGRYVLEGRVFFTTSYFTGAIVFGFGRADQVVRMHVSGGDFLYSAGINKEAAKLDSIGWSLTGRRTRDGGLSGAAARGTFQFPNERATFRYSILVDGAEAHAFIDDRWVGSYADLAGALIEGHVGFAAGHGAIRVVDATVRRLDRGRASGLRLLREDGLDVAQSGSLKESGLKNRRVAGIPPHPLGVLLFWIAPPEAPPSSPEEESFEFDGVLELARRLPEFRTSAAFPQPVVVALPASLGEERIAQFRSVLKDRGGDEGVTVISHVRKAPLRTFGEEDRPKSPVPTLVFVDPSGFYRAHADWQGYPDAVPDPVAHFVRVFRGRR